MAAVIIYKTDIEDNEDYSLMLAIEGQNNVLSFSRNGRALLVMKVPEPCNEIALTMAITYFKARALNLLLKGGEDDESVKKRLQNEIVKKGNAMTQNNLCAEDRGQDAREQHAQAFEGACKSFYKKLFHQ